MILCVGLAADKTFVHTLAALRRERVAFHAIDMAQLALGGEVCVRLEDASHSTLATKRSEYRLESYSAAWVRLLDISTQAPTEALRRRSTGIFHALSRLFQILPIKTINPPGRDSANFTKLFHASFVAKAIGWQIPRSCLTNDPRVAKDFVAECAADGAIFKGASARKTWATRYNPSLHESRLPFLTNGPALFQELIAGPDVRVHAVGDSLSAELIESESLDYRTTRNNKFQRVDLPQRVADGCRLLTEITGVPFLGIDFKVRSATGEWYFLEANSMPCYQGYDVRAGGAISRALVNWLVRS